MIQKNDVIFKNLFGVAQNKDLMDFLNKILDFKENRIIDLIYMNTEIVPEIETLNKNEINNQIKFKEYSIEKYGRMGLLDRQDYSLRSADERKKRKYENVVFPENIDLIAKNVNNQRINIEIQINGKGHMGKRSLYSAFGIIFHSLSKCIPYEEIPDQVVINILNYNVIDHTIVNRKKFNSNEEYKAVVNQLKNRCHSIYNIRNVQSNSEEIFENSLVFHFIEIPKFKNKINENQLESKKYSWIKFLIEPEAYKNTYNKLFMKAMDCLKYLESNKKICDAYAQREKDEMNHKFSMSKYGKQKYDQGMEKGKTIGIVMGIEEGKTTGIEMGIKEGKEEGIEIVIEEGRKIERKEAMRGIYINSVLSKLKYKNCSLDDIKVLSHLSENEINIISNFLNNPSRNIRKLAIDLDYDVNTLREICDEENINYVDKEIDDNNKKRRLE